MRRRRACILLIVSPFVLLILWDHSEYYKEEEMIENVSEQELKDLTCGEFFKSWNLSFPVILIDESILERINDRKCALEDGKSVKIAVDVQDRPKFLTIYEKHPFEVTYFKTDSSKDYLELLTDAKRIIPKNFKSRQVGNFRIAKNIPIFLEFMRRSKFVDCLGLHIPRNRSEPVLDPVYSSATLAQVRDDLLESGMFSFLNGGTFLGWYRECTVIPHTTDMDISVLLEDFNTDYLKVLEKRSSRFRMIRKLGYLNDSFEISVSPRRGKHIQIDIFMMYNEKNSSWVGAMKGDGSKYRFIDTPIYDPYCSADLHGHIFWTSCIPHQRAVNQYGPQFHIDHYPNRYWWYGKVPNGNWTKHDMDTFIWGDTVFSFLCSLFPFYW